MPCRSRSGSPEPERVRDRGTVTVDQVPGIGVRQAVTPATPLRDRPPCTSSSPSLPGVPRRPRSVRLVQFAAGGLSTPHGPGRARERSRHCCQYRTTSTAPAGSRATSSVAPGCAWRSGTIPSPGRARRRRRSPPRRDVVHRRADVGPAGPAGSGAAGRLAVEDDDRGPGERLRGGPVGKPPPAKAGVAIGRYASRPARSTCSPQPERPPRSLPPSPFPRAEGRSCAPGPRGAGRRDVAGQRRRAASTQVAIESALRRSAASARVGRPPRPQFPGHVSGEQVDLPGEPETV